MSKVKLSTSGERVVIELTPVQVVNLLSTLEQAGYKFKSNEELKIKLDMILDHFNLEDSIDA